MPRSMPELLARRTTSPSPPLHNARSLAAALNLPSATMLRLARSRQPLKAMNAERRQLQLLVRQWLHRCVNALAHRWN